MKTEQGHIRVVAYCEDCEYRQYVQIPKGEDDFTIPVCRIKSCAGQVRIGAKRCVSTTTLEDGYRVRCERNKGHEPGSHTFAVRW
jgi:hypothetical protein